jgi:aminoglycoside 3-N-acetyltransferase
MSVATAGGTMTREKVTRERLLADLCALGVRSGQTLLVHASLRQIGWVDGGAPVVVDVLREALGPDGTLVAGAGTPENSMTSRTFQSATDGFTPAQVVGFRGRMPAFDRENTPTSVGAVAEAVRTARGAVRSDHPQSSFSAVGRHARALMDGHRVDCHLGEESPLAKLYDKDASILLLGVGYETCTAFHLAEYRYTAQPPMQTYSCVVATRGKRHWLTYQDVVLDDGEFDIIGKSLEEKITVPCCNIGKAPSRLFPLRLAVDFATEWLMDRRSVAQCERGSEIFPTLGAFA